MATKTTTKNKPRPEELIVNKYIDHVLTHGEAPASVYTFCKDLKIKEDTFYQNFASFKSVEKAIFTGFFRSTMNRIQKDSNFDAFTAREKLLAFYFTLIEELRKNRSFILATLNTDRRNITPPALKEFKKEYLEFVSGILAEGMDNKEVVERPYISKRYSDAFWLQALFIMDFWKKDESAGFEQTDVAIEKSVNLSFDLVGRGTLDNIIDFGKFLIQNR